MDHALKCKKGNLVCIRHNGVRNEAGQCGVLATSKLHVSYEPNIFYDVDVTANGSNNTSQQGTGSRTLGDEARRGHPGALEAWRDLHL